MPRGGKKKGQKAEASKEEPVNVSEEKNVEEEGETGLGLGPSSAKRKQKKEKKQMQELERQAVITKPIQTPGSSRESSEVPKEPPKPKEPEPEVKSLEAKVAEVEEAFDGLGIGGAKKRKPKKKKADAPATEPEQAPAPAQTVTVPQAPAVAQLATATATKPTSTLVQMSSSPSCPLPSFPSRTAQVEQSGPPPSAWGRGRGRGAIQGPPRPIPTSQSVSQISQQAPQSTSKPYQPPQKAAGKPARSEYSQDNIMCKYKIPSKVGPGRLVPSKSVTIITNYLEMTFEPLNISRYDVSFTPDRPKKLIPEAFKRLKAKYYPRELLAFDQTKNCYSLRPLANVPPNERFNTFVDVIDNQGKTMKFEVSLKATGVVELGKIKRYMSERGASVLHPTEEIQCIDVILRQGTLESYVKAGRQFFRRPARPIDLGLGYEMWTGLFQSAIFTSKAFINIDVAHKGFPKEQSLLECMIKDFGLRTDRLLDEHREDTKLFANYLKGLRLTASLLDSDGKVFQKREYMCNGLGPSSRDMKFIINDPDKGDRHTTVYQYFQKDKKYNIKYPNLNTVWVGPKERKIHFPMELLWVTYGQPLAKQLHETQVSKMVREAATPPDIRLRKITEVIASMKYSTNPDFKQFGLNISENFHQVRAKVLEAPVLDIGRGNTVPRKGMWQANQLLKPEALQAWGFVALDTGYNIDFEGVIHTLVNTGRSMGMNVSPPLFKKFDAQFSNLTPLLLGAIDAGVKFLFIVISTRGYDHYHRIKQAAEREIGLLTQCLKEATTRRMNAMTAKNILLKVNSKLMGINQALAEKTIPRCLKEGGVMIVGADVTHPSPEQSNVPSIAAVTASIDAKCFMYNIELSIQTPKKEMIVQFEDMMFDHLRVYKERNHQLPRKIFVFRDGVSEGQFVQVMNSELAAVHAAYQRMAGASKKPEILFLLVQKRHHTRFFNRGEGAQYNVEPGTVVDTDIVHSSELDFYLVSHHALKGTARPTRYHAVCNDGRLPDDEVEQLTYYLCHLYARCMRSVSYPTPTYYAHLACLRARSLTTGINFKNSELEFNPQRLRVLDKMLQYSRMFFV